MKENDKKVLEVALKAVLMICLIFLFVVTIPVCYNMNSTPMEVLGFILVIIYCLAGYFVVTFRIRKEE